MESRPAPAPAPGRLAATVLGSAACVLAAGCWATGLRQGLHVGALAWAYGRHLEGEPGWMAVGLALVVPLGALPLAIVVAAAGLLWETRWGLPVAAATAAAGAGYLVGLFAISRVLLGFAW